MKISELIKRLQDIQRNHGDCECGCLCETDDIWDDDIEYFSKLLKMFNFIKVLKFLHVEKIC